MENIEIKYRTYVGYDRYSDYDNKGYFQCWLVKPRKNFDSEIVGIVLDSNGHVLEVPYKNIKFPKIK